MKTSGFRCETKFGLLVFLGHPNVHATKQMLITYPFEKVGLILIVEVNIVKAKDGWG